jgi:hypothetical protein
MNTRGACAPPQKSAPTLGVSTVLEVSKARALGRNTPN